MNVQRAIPDRQQLKLTVENFELLDRAGVFKPYAKVELIEGLIYTVNAEYRRHNVAKNRLAFKLNVALKQLSSRYEALTESTIRLGPTDLPQADVIVALAQPDHRYYELGDLAIVIEVADTSLMVDRNRKQPLYAGAGVPEYWIVNLRDETVTVLWGAADGVYHEQLTVRLAGEVRSATLPDLAIDGSGIL